MSKNTGSGNGSRERDPVGAKKAARYAVERALPNASLHELRALAALLALMRFYDRTEDRVSMRQVAALISGQDAEDVAGWERDRATDSVRALARRGIITYVPGHGRGAMATIGFPPAPDPEPDELVDNDAKDQSDPHVFDRETPADPARVVDGNTSSSSAKHQQISRETPAADGAHRGITDPSSVLPKSGHEDQQSTTDERGRAVANVTPLFGDDTTPSKKRHAKHVADARASARGATADKLVTRLLDAFNERKIRYTRDRVQASVDRMRKLNIGDNVIDVAIGKTIESKGATLAFFETTCRNEYVRLTGQELPT
jgi:hypothetical protein